MTSIRCPKCGYSRHWKIRRSKLRCKRCRAEFSPRKNVDGHHMSRSALRRSVFVFVVHRTVRRVAAEARIAIATAQKRCHLFRLAIDSEPRMPFMGPVEVDETYIGAQRKNQRLHIRRLYPPKRGHGTQKLPIIGAHDRATGTVRVEV